MKEKLQALMKCEIEYTPILNIMLNNRTKDWYDELGKYIVQNLEIEKIPHLQFFAEKLKQPKGLVKSLFKDRTYSSIAIFFLTSALDPKSLKKMFGTPLKHNEFGGESKDPNSTTLPTSSPWMAWTFTSDTITEEPG